MKVSCFTRRNRFARIIGLMILLPGLVLAQNKIESVRSGFSFKYPETYEGWPDAFLSGNGKMGIMVLGNPLEETIVFNDRGFNLSTGTVRSFEQVSSADLEKIRDLAAAGNFAEANHLAATAPNYKGGGEGARHPGYGMFISIPPAGEILNYSRTCDFRTGEVIVRWTDGRGDWLRKAFVSRKDNVTVQSLMAPSKGKLDCSIRLETIPGMGLPKEMVFTRNAKTSELTIKAKYKPKLDAGYEGVTRVVVMGGTTKVEDFVLKIEGAQSVLLLSRTKKYFDHCEEEWNRGEIQKSLAVLPTDYDVLLKGHLELHQVIYDRVKLDLNASVADRAKSNEQLLEEQRNSNDPVPALWERIFDAGRYYYLSSSSSETPPDLLGIWTGDCRAGWGGFYHLDANLNLQIGGGNVGAMPEAMEGYFKINEAWAPDFTINARKLLGTRGMVAGGNTPGPQSGLMAGISEYYPYHYATGEEPWLLYPFWEHYLITGDKVFLKERLYPLFKEMGHFYEDFLLKEDANGKYIFAGSVSPEAQPSNLKVSLVNNSVFDISGARFALSTLIETCKVLGFDQEAGGGVERWTRILNKLPPYLINEDGALKEWAWPGLGDNYGHRHSSHLLTAWPYREITPESDPTLFKAAQIALLKKGANNLGTGHGLLHVAFIAAVLKNDEMVRNKLLRLTKEDFYFDSLFSSHNGKHEIFCSDTCNAIPGIMIEMLVSSEPGRLEFLPALPEGLEKGSISGVKGRNRVTVENLAWDRTARTLSAVIRSDIDQDLTLLERDGIQSIQTTAPVSDSPWGGIARTVKLKAGEKTTLALTLGKLRVRPVNLARGKPVTVSSDDGKNLAAGAVDGNAGSRWASENKDDQWIAVDLGSSKKIREIRLSWEAAAARDFDLQVSADGTAWKTIKSVTGNSKTGLLDYPDFSAEGRYVRVLGKSRLTSYGFSLWELEVFGDE